MYVKLEFEGIGKGLVLNVESLPAVLNESMTGSDRAMVTVLSLTDDEFARLQASDEVEECDCNEGYGYDMNCGRCNGTGWVLTEQGNQD